MSEQETFQCCICNEVFTGWGNNPYPISQKEDDRCCDICDGSVVIPARLDALLKSGKY